jgi:uncharacterized protein (TIGR03437 family)
MLLRIFRVLALPFLTALASAQPSVTAVVNAASYSGALAPGCWAAIYGSGFAQSEGLAPSVPLPLQLNGVSVTFDGKAAPLLYVSSRQVNALVPFDVAIPSNMGLPVAMMVTAPGGSSSRYYVWLERSAPAIYTRDSSGQGKAWYFDAGFRPLDTVGNDPIILYAACLGPTNPAPSSSQSGGNAIEPFNRVADNVEVYVGDKKADLLFAGLAPGFPGIYQLNVSPAGVVSDRLYLRTKAWQSNVTQVGIAVGANVTNVTGAIDGLYPATNPSQPPYNMTPMAAPASFSVMPLAGAFSVAFDIQPDARPFQVLATGEAGSTLISINPQAGTWDATVIVPTPAARAGDFSNTEFVAVWDFFTLTPTGLMYPLPNNILPRSRMDPSWAISTQYLPVPNVAWSGSSMGQMKASGTVTRGTRFVIDSQTNSSLAVFGGFIQISPFGAKDRKTSFSLYVDGRLIASKDAQYRVP